MKILISVLLMTVMWATSAYAVNMSIDSLIQVSNTPTSVGSKWQVECGTSTGVYNSFTKQFNTGGIPILIVPASAIFNGAGNFFCRTTFVQPYGQGPYSTEVSVTIIVPALSAPSLTVIP